MTDHRSSPLLSEPLERTFSADMLGAVTPNDVSVSTDMVTSSERGEISQDRPQQWSSCKVLLARVIKLHLRMRSGAADRTATRAAYEILFQVLLPSRSHCSLFVLLDVSCLWFQAHVLLCQMTKSRAKSELESKGSLTAAQMQSIVADAAAKLKSIL